MRTVKEEEEDRGEKKTRIPRVAYSHLSLSLSICLSSSLPPPTRSFSLLVRTEVGWCEEVVTMLTSNTTITITTIITTITTNKTTTTIHTGRKEGGRSRQISQERKRRGTYLLIQLVKVLMHHMAKSQCSDSGGDGRGDDSEGESFNGYRRWEGEDEEDVL